MKNPGSVRKNTVGASENKLSLDSSLIPES